MIRPEVDDHLGQMSMADEGVIGKQDRFNMNSFGDVRFLTQHEHCDINCMFF